MHEQVKTGKPLEKERNDSMRLSVSKKHYDFSSKKATKVKKTKVPVFRYG